MNSRMLKLKLITELTAYAKETFVRRYILLYVRSSFSTTSVYYILR